MTVKVVTSVVAQNRFGELLDNAQREPIMITRHGRPVAHLVSDETYRALTSGLAQSSEKVAAYLHAIDAFRGQGQGGAIARLMAERRADALKEA